ncbi:IS3 family transposase [Streptomyces sp. SID9727]|uniref:IS3 family transposase n=1 Tax=Streptomyces sp. SID9727 TaxID=2706114 RepID=UPI001942A117
MKRLCQVLEVNRSSYYKWRAGQEARAARQRADQRLAARIREVHGESRGTYGSPRMTTELRDQGLHVNEKRIARVMRTFATTGVRLRRRVRTTVPDPAASQAVWLVKASLQVEPAGEAFAGGWDATRVIISTVYRITRALLSVPGVLLRRHTAKAPNCWCCGMRTRCCDGNSLVRSVTSPRTGSGRPRCRR